MKALSSAAVVATATAVLCALSLPGPAWGWWDQGHTVVAEVARLQLNATTQAAVDAYLAVDRASYPDLSSLPYAAVWPDYAKLDLHVFDSWHYVDFPYCPAGWTNASLPAETNLLDAMPAMLAALRQTVPHPQPPAGGIPGMSWGNAQWTKAFAIRFMAHLVGDCHQPLHAVSYWTQRYPSGDAGGNLFGIRYTSPVDGQVYSNLHSLYDSVGGLWAGYMPLPVTAEYAALITQTASDLMARYPPSFFPQLAAERATPPFNFSGWAQESYALAISSAYTQLTPGQTLTQEFVANLQTLLQQRVVLAGYRLARVLAVADLSAAPVPPATGGGDGGSGLSSREIGFLVLMFIALVAAFGAYYAGFQRGKDAHKQASEGVALLAQPSSAGGSSSSSGAAAARAKADSRVTDVTVEVHADSIVHSGYEEQSRVDAAHAAKQKPDRR